MRLRTRSIVVLLACPALVGCGAGEAHSRAPSAGAQALAFKGAPAALSALHAQANRLLGGGMSAFRARLAALRGYFPQALFFSRRGHAAYVFDHAGPYASAAALESDIRQYALR